ncbi:MAG TPA: polysaccharide biosynthesis protein [Candidatus Bathyarchaeia archaeon]|nr:polysaccharide biosynthesis protein [Candidatus Bathyarchaeia archaeon]
MASQKTQEKILMPKFFKGKHIFITGGTGSFGHTIVGELLKLDVSKVTVYSRDEEKQLDMEGEFSDPRLDFVIGDVRDYDRLRETIKPRTDIVYHAAALKVIPTCEKHPLEAVKTNLLGSINVRKACLEKDVGKALLISTDKAVKPVNAYGMTKALAEKIWISDMKGLSTLFSVVRYGNVVGSRGSVVPYFQNLMSQKKPLPITDRRMSRFLITLKQAINLVFKATATMVGGEIFVPKIPACKVTDLAEAMGGNDYPITITGIRPGEKIAEVLISEEEIRRTKDLEKYFVIEPHGSAKTQELLEEYTSENTTQLKIEEIKELIS